MRKLWVIGIMLLCIGAGVVHTITITVRADLATGLTAYWTFDDGSGTTALDSSGNGNTGILHGATWTTAGKVNGALHFNGINSWVEVPDSDRVDLQKNFTVACWVYPDVHVGNYNMLVSKHQPNINDDHSWYWGIKNDVSTFVNWAGPEIHGTQDIPLNSWTHVAITYIDATTSFCFYNNGQLDTQLDADLSLRNIDKMLFIGSENGTTNFYNGLMDDVRIYNRALTSDEIHELYQSPEVHQNEPPISNFTWTPLVSTPNQPITFNASTSRDTDGSITKYEWDWNNDGIYEEYHSTPTATHSWDQAGSYPVTLQVIDNSGATGIKTITVTVRSGENEPPHADFTWSPPTPIQNQSITFDASGSNDPDGSITKYEWDWNNDGTYEEFHSTPTATHSWDQVGSYPVKVQVTDNDGATSIKTLTVAVSSSSGSETTNTGTPGFELIVLIGAITVVMFLWRTKRNL
jgi:PKD repeat protein